MSQSTSGNKKMKTSHVPSTNVSSNKYLPEVLKLTLQERLAREHGNSLNLNNYLNNMISIHLI